MDTPRTETVTTLFLLDTSYSGSLAAVTDSAGAVLPAKTTFGTAYGAAWPLSRLVGVTRRRIMLVVLKIASSLSVSKVCLPFLFPRKDIDPEYPNTALSNDVTAYSALTALATRHKSSATGSVIPNYT